MTREEQLKAQIEALRAELKAVKANKPREQWYYTIEQGCVCHKHDQSLPKTGVFAYWEGESGAKKLKLMGDFKAVVKQQSEIGGQFAFRIKPVLKECGFIWSPRTKTWVNPKAEDGLPV